MKRSSPGRSRPDGRDRHDGGGRLYAAGASGVPAAGRIVHGGCSAGCASPGGCGGRSPDRALPAPALGRMELGPRLVQLQSLAAGLFHPFADLGLDRVAPVGRSEQPQHRFAIGDDDVVVARRLRLDQPLDIVVVAFERELNARRYAEFPVTAADAFRARFLTEFSAVSVLISRSAACRATRGVRGAGPMKRSGSVALVLMGAATFAATFAGGMAYFAWQKPSHAAPRSPPQANRPARRDRTARRTASRSGAAMPTTSIRAGSPAGRGVRAHRASRVRARRRPRSRALRRAIHATTRRQPRATPCAAASDRPQAAARIARPPPAAKLAACSESPATSGRTGRPRPRRPASAFTPFRASATGTSAPITPSRWSRSSATSRRRPPSSMRCAANSSRARSTTSACCACCAFRSASGPSSRQAGSATTRASMAGSIFPTTAKGPRSCSNTTPTRRPRCSRRACSSGCGWKTPRRCRSRRTMPISTTRCMSG